MAEGAWIDQALARIAELEQELANTRAQFRLAEQAARVGYWRITLPDYQTTWSPGMSSIFGLDPTISRSSDIGSYPLGDRDDVRHLLELIRTAVETRSRLSARATIHSIDGSERIVEIVGDLEFGPDGNPIAIAGATRDVTELVTAELERNRVEELQRVLTDAASDVMVVHDPQGNIQFASPALERILGWTTREYTGETVLRLVHPDDVPAVMKMATTAAPGEFTTATYRIRHADGRYIWVETKLTVVCIKSTGDIRYIVTVMRDVSDRKAHELALVAAREAAEAANRAKSSFLANMSHELRTPLNAIIGFADMMGHEMLGSLGNPRYREYVSLIHKSGQHLLDLINDILDVAKIEAGKHDLNIKEIDLVEAIHECIRTVADRAENSGISLNVTIPAQGLMCYADQRALKQIVLNLLSNAIKFTSAGGRIDVTARLDDELVRIEVRDTGIGVAAEDLPRLARPFVQVCDDPMLAKAGTGLGLALVRALVEQHGGHFKIDSPGQQGTIATVEFPRVVQQSAAA